MVLRDVFELNPLNADLNPICHLLVLIGVHLIFHVSRIRVKRDEVTGEWRRLHNEKLHKFCSSPNNIWAIKSIRIRLKVHVTRMGRRQVHWKVLVVRTEGHERRRSTGSPRSRWEDSIKK
jgi:hypothetical protein